MAEEQGLDLRERMKALRYEHDMLCCTSEALLSGIAGKSPMGNALLESFLIHARLLITFLYGPYKKDDIRPENWLRLDEWKQIRPEQTQLLRDTKRDADKYLAHLTNTRLHRKKKWDCPAIVEGIDAVLHVFYGKVRTCQNRENHS